MKKIVCIMWLVLLVTAVFCHATPYIHSTISADGTLGASPDPLQTVLVSDNFSHTVDVRQTLWYDLVYQGSGTCYVRLMNTTAKASWVAEPVTTGTTHSYLIHGSTNFLNYSGCSGSVLHMQ